jgi:hypothetical protein
MECMMLRGEGENGLTLGIFLPFICTPHFSIFGEAWVFVSSFLFASTLFFSI